ncbi:MAG TPA: CZB domain-containing protein [Oscillatoriaceae cyanobacterium M33_DOE_052]|uniref:Chemoreceptor zinc-binding domain-containing protein n=1 Tax=Planktothricoides sp. SpSt-374 TaxID=2282167 RepID=A0A7C3VJN8_9CYAN|nr:CZB domain-containing protein [Oscillatoriaceae cyanobacterium M33_DOE_052]
MVNFSLAKAKHAIWNVKLTTFIGCNNAAAPENCLVSYRDCQFGKWLYTQGLSGYRTLAEMREIELVHRQLHQMALEVIQLKEANQIQMAQEKVIEMQIVSQRMMQLMDKVAQTATVSSQN